MKRNKYQRAEIRNIKRVVTKVKHKINNVKIAEVKN